MIRLGKEPAQHLYQLGVDGNGLKRGQIEVLANTRAQARKLAERAGYVVRDVNMIG